MTASDCLCIGGFPGAGCLRGTAVSSDSEPEWLSDQLTLVLTRRVSIRPLRSVNWWPIYTEWYTGQSDGHVVGRYLEQQCHQGANWRTWVSVNASHIRMSPQLISMNFAFRMISAATRTWLLDESHRGFLHWLVDHFGMRNCGKLPRSRKSTKVFSWQFCNWNFVVLAFNSKLVSFPLHYCWKWNTKAVTVNASFSEYGSMQVPTSFMFG